MKYFKYSMVLLLWLLIKPLCFGLTVLIIALWGSLLQLDKWWAYLLAFSPTILFYGFLMCHWVYNKFNEIEKHNDAMIDLSIFIVILFSAIPPIIIGLVICGISFCFEFPSKSHLKRLQYHDESILKTFAGLFSI